MTLKLRAEVELDHLVVARETLGSFPREHVDDGKCAGDEHSRTRIA
jgi:hypothetical protein